MNHDNIAFIALSNSQVPTTTVFVRIAWGV